jgi:hypothetical protein
MFDAKQAPPACIYLLGDHLDAALAAGEDLAATTLHLTPPSASGGFTEIETRQEELATFLNRLRALEAALVARVLHARRRAEEIPRPDAHLKPLVSLFLAGTTALVDAVEEFGDPSGLAFNAGSDGFYFLRNRSLIRPEDADLPLAGVLSADEDYLIVGRIRLGSLMDLVSMFLEALDIRFNLYDEAIAEGTEDAVRETPPVPVAARSKAVRDATAAKGRPQLVAEALEALYGPGPRLQT